MPPLLTVTLAQALCDPPLPRSPLRLCLRGLPPCSMSAQSLREGDIWRYWQDKADVALEGSRPITYVGSPVFRHQRGPS
jgi:hypothetical protein